MEKVKKEVHDFFEEMSSGIQVASKMRIGQIKNTCGMGSTQDSTGSL